MFNLNTLLEKIKHLVRHDDGGHYLDVINTRHSRVSKALLEVTDGLLPRTEASEGTSLAENLVLTMVLPSS